MRTSAKNKRVVFVDDDDDTLDTLRMAFADALFGVKFLPDGGEAVALYDECRAAGEPIDLFVLDGSMPRVSGFEVCQHIRDAGDDETKLLIVSAHTGPMMRPHAARYNAGFIEKPFDIAELRRAVDDALCEAG